VIPFLFQTDNSLSQKCWHSLQFKKVKGRSLKNGLELKGGSICQSHLLANVHAVELEVLKR